MPSLADLRKYEEEHQTTPLSDLWPGEAPVAPPPSPPAPSRQETLLEKWQRIWEETRDLVQPGPEVIPPPQQQVEWWETADGYTSTEIPEEEYREVLPLLRDEGPSPTERITTQPEEGLTPWQRIWSGVQKRIEKEAEYVSQGLREIKEEPRKVIPGLLNTLFGWPFGTAPDEQRGVVWAGAWELASDGLAKAWRRVDGLMASTNPFDATTGGLDRSLLLAQGIYAEALESLPPAPGVSDEEYERRIQKAREAQLAYDQRVQEQVKGGFPVVRATQRALAQASKAIQETEVEERPEWLLRLYQESKAALPEAAEAFERGERVLPWTANAEEAWRMAAGYRYSHSYKPELRRAYEELVDQGWDPDEAGSATEDRAFEEMCLFMADPNWFLQLDNLVWGPVWWAGKKVAGAVGKGALAVATRIPVVKTGVNWALSLSAQTAGNYAARNVDDIAHLTARWLRSQNIMVSGEALESVLRNPPPQLLADMPAYYRRALAGVQPYLDDVIEILTARAGLEVLEKGLKDVTDLTKAAMIVDELFDDAVSKASGMAYSKAVDAVAKKNPWLQKGLVRWLSGNSVVRTMTDFNSVAVDTWLGLRPSWNVFNMVDNTVKLALDGVSPFTSVPNMLRRYGSYMEGAPAWADDVERLRDIPFWRIGGEVSEEYVETLQKMVPRQAGGTFAAGVRQRPSKLQKLPGTKQMIEWQTSLAERIEMTYRARAYLHHFFDAIDSGWDDILQRPIVSEIVGQPMSLSDEAAAAVRAKLKTVQNPTPEKVRAILEDVLRVDRLEVVNPRLGLGIDDTFHHLDDDVVKGAKQYLDDLVRLGDSGPQVVTIQEIDGILDDTAQELVRRYNETVQAGMRTLDDMLPGLSDDVDDMLRVLTAGMDDPSMEALARAVDDFPMLEKRFHLEWDKKLADHWEKIHQAKADGVSGLMRGKLHDEFFEARKTAWTEFVDKQQELLTKVADQIDEMLPEGQMFPREQIFDEYLDAADRLNLLEMERNRLKRKFGVLTGQGRFQEAELATKQFDDMFNKVKPELDAKLHDTLVSARQWFQSEGLDLPEKLDLDELAKGAGWWRVDQQLKDIPTSARKVLDDQFAELRTWREAIMETRVRPYAVAELTDFDRTILSDYGARLVNDTRSLVSDATDTAVQKVNDLLFDYESTSNLMRLVGNVVPFVRFPSKNLPLWADKFAEVPHLIGGVAGLRRVQAAINKERGVPARHQYSITIPRQLTDWLMEPLGFHNTELRFNPWSFISIFQQMPGGTPYKARELQELHEDERDRAWKGNMEVVTTYMQQFGFGMWPWVEYVLGATGMMGDSWYPRGVFSTWAPLVNWGLKSVFGYDRNYDIDQTMRRQLPRFWNTAFGGGPLAWEELTPDLMEQWITGREVEGIIMRLPDDPEALTELAQLTPTQVRQTVQRLEGEGQLDAVRRKVAPVFELPHEKQVEALQNMTPDELAVFLDEMQRVAARKQIQKSAFTTFFGNVTGLYLEPAGIAEVEARRLRYEKRREKELLDVGPEQRDFERQFREEHPKYGLIQTWRFGQFPWGETAAGREAELWDSTIQDAVNEYWDWREQFDEEREKAIETFYRTRPGDKHGLKALEARLRQERLAKVDYLNQRLTDDLRERMEEYERLHPNDRRGIELLRQGFETEMYVGTHLTAEQQEKLRMFRKANPDDALGLDNLFAEMWEEAKRLNPPVQPQRWPGLDEGFQMNLKWNPNSYSEEEVRQRLIGDLIRELADQAPDREEYEDGDVWWEEFNTYLDNLPDHALELKEVQQQVEVLMQNSGMSRDEAEETVKQWYSRDEYDLYWRQFDNKWKALENAFQSRWIAEWDDQWYGELDKLREEDYTLYAAAREDLFAASGPRPASEFIAYVMDMYPGRWTLKELQEAYEGVVMPSYETRRRIRTTGEAALNAHVWYFYNQLPGEAKRLVRERFGDSFTALFLEGRAEEVSPELRGDWITALSRMVGQDFDWHKLPGVQDVLEEKGGKRDAHDFGLPVVGPGNEAEFARAQEIEREYWRLRAAGDERYKELEDNPLRKKWFGTSTSKGYFWTYYYDKIPPGWVAKELRNHPAIQIVLDRDVRYAVAEDRDYDRAIEVMENWLMFNADALSELGFSPEEYEAARALINKYYEIPYENKGERRAFIDANPLLRKYLYESSSSRTTRSFSSQGGGSQRSGYTSKPQTVGGREEVEQPVVDYNALWSGFRTAVGESYGAVMRMLVRYWHNGVFAGPKTEAYLRDLHARVGGGLDFDKWLEVLRRVFEQLRGDRSSGVYTTRGPDEPPRPHYPTRTTGQRRVRI